MVPAISSNEAENMENKRGAGMASGDIEVKGFGD